MSIFSTRGRFRPASADRLQSVWAPMTVLEMLDVVESKIALLQTERIRLLSALEDAEKRLRTIGEALRPSSVEGPKRPKRSRNAGGPHSPGKVPASSLASETNTTTVERGCRPVGKRVALGRGLAELRKTSARNRQEPR